MVGGTIRKMPRAQRLEAFMALIWFHFVKLSTLFTNLNKFLIRSGAEFSILRYSSSLNGSGIS